MPRRRRCDAGASRRRRPAGGRNRGRGRAGIPRRGRRRLQQRHRGTRDARRRPADAARAGHRSRRPPPSRGARHGPCRRRGGPRPHRGDPPPRRRRRGTEGSLGGRVHLVGGGPGDPGLLALRGQRCLAAAEVVVHDDLVSRRLLEHARPDAEIVAVGGAHGDPARLGQDVIEALLVARARAGKTVVRLKNGDPFLFGRGAEEAEALRRAGIPFEVVPGVTAALAVPAYAGIPATHRDHASLITIATGYQARPAPDAEPTVPALPWSALARQGGTLVFLMGMRQLPLIMTKLMEHGLARDTPAAVVERGTTGRQRTVVATVATLAERVRGAGLGPPGVVVVGNVVGVRERVRWFEDRPLFGRRVVLTRARAQAGELARPLEEAGADVIVFPTIAIGPPRDPAALDRAVASAFQYDWIVFPSPNGVRVFFERFATQGRDVRELAQVRLAAIGPETAAELGRP